MALPDSYSLIQPFQDYLKFEKRYSAHTVRSYTDDLAQFFQYIEANFGKTALPDISASSVRSWLATLKSEQLSAKSINRKISSLKSFFKYQLRSGTIEQSPMQQVTSPKIRKRLPVYV